jgi:hypothetical protein
MILGNEDIFAVDTKITQVEVKKSATTETQTRELSLLSFQIKQGLHERIKQDIFGLAKEKQQGLKVGRVKFKETVQNIPLKQ